MNKFNPHFELRLQFYRDGKLNEAIVTDPMSIRFTIQKNTFSTTNQTKVTVFNLDVNTRTGIYQDNLLFGEREPKKLWLSAGYGDALTLISYGYIQQCYTTRQGVDVVTEIIVIDPDILTCSTGVTFAEGTEKKEAYLNLVGNSLPSLEVGAGAENVSGTFQIDTVFNGNSFLLVNQLTGGHSFIDDGVIHTLYENQTISNYGVYYIAGETGLLGTPVRQDARLEIKMLFEPKIKIGQLVEIKSETQSRFDGQYKVIGLTHDCSISNAEGGTRTTTLQLLYTDYVEMANVSLTGTTTPPKATQFRNKKEVPVDSAISTDDEGICRYIKTHGGNVPTGKQGMINPRISWKEMLYTSGKNTKNDVKNEVTPQIIANCRAIANRLYSFCDIYFKGKKIIITSSFRTKYSNSHTEGASANSNHLYGSAIDFHLGGVKLSTLKSVFRANWKYGRLLNYNWGIHVSNNPRERVG